MGYIHLVEDVGKCRGCSFCVRDPAYIIKIANGVYGKKNVIVKEEGILSAVISVNGSEFSIERGGMHLHKFCQLRIYGYDENDTDIVEDFIKKVIEPLKVSETVKSRMYEVKDDE